jgi:hypothetical protein
MDGLGWTQAWCFVIATGNWAAAVYRSAGDPCAVAVLVGHYLVTLLAVYCLHAVRRVPPGPGRRRLKAAGAVLTSILISMSAGKLAATFSSIMLPWAAVSVWVVAAGPVALMLWGAFCRRQAV